MRDDGRFPDAAVLAGPTAWFDRYRGLSLQAAESLARAERRTVRVITPETEAITADLRPSRLNIWLRSDGTLDGMSPG